MSREALRRQIRMNVAEALHQGATKVDVMSDLLCVTRGVGQPGQRERDDAEDLADVWGLLDAATVPAPPG